MVLPSFIDVPIQKLLETLGGNLALKVHIK